MGKFCQIYQKLKFKKQNLAGLFDVKIEVKPMPIQVDIRKTFLYKWGEEEGRKKRLCKRKTGRAKRRIEGGIKESNLVRCRSKVWSLKGKENQKTFGKNK